MDCNIKDIVNKLRNIQWWWSYSNSELTDLAILIIKNAISLEYIKHYDINTYRTLANNSPDILKNIPIDTTDKSIDHTKIKFAISKILSQFEFEYHTDIGLIADIFDHKNNIPIECGFTTPNKIIKYLKNTKKYG